MCDRSALTIPLSADEIRERKLRELFCDARQTYPWLHHRSLVRKIWPLMPEGGNLKLLIEIAEEFPIDAGRRTG